MLPGVGVFGSYPLVKVFIPVLKENGFKIEAIWNRTKQEAQEIAKGLDIPFYTNKIDDVLLRKEVDLIFVLCSPNLHAQISVKALGIGKHVVCDKPGGLNQSDTLKMVKASQYYPSLISLMNYSFRFLPAFMNMRKAIQDNYLKTPINLIDIRVHSGRLTEHIDGYDWRCDDVMGGGALNLIGSHVIDLVTFLTGQKAVRVHGIIRTFIKNTDTIKGIRNLSAPDFCSFQLELKNGILVTATLNSYTHANSYQQEVLVCSDHAYLMVRGGDLYGRHHGPEEALYVDEDDLNYTIPDTDLPKPFVKGLCKMVGSVKEAFMPVKEKAGWIKEPVALAAGFDDALYIQAVLSAIRESSKTHQWVNIHIMTELLDLDAGLSAAVRKSAISIS